VRVVHNIGRHWQTKEWRVTGVDVYNDKCAAPPRAAPPCAALPGPPLPGPPLPGPPLRRGCGAIAPARAHARACRPCRRSRPRRARPRRWDGPFRGKRELTACGYGETGFAKQARLAAELLQGSWRVVSGARYGAGGASELAAGEQLAVEAEGAVLLPLGVWSRFSAQGESLVLEAGRVLEGGALLLARRSYVDGALAEVLLVEAAR
jgi:hypothetical protein